MIEFESGFYIDPEYKEVMDSAHLRTIDDVFSFKGTELEKYNIASFRKRIRFEADGRTFYLKRYDRPPVIFQLKNWARHRRRCCTAALDAGPEKLRQMDINLPRVIAFGQEFSALFEKKSFIITEQISGESIERKLPEFFYQNKSETMRERNRFLSELADTVRRFHNSGMRHRDLYFSHIFYTDQGQFFLIDLARVFEPVLLKERFRIKDLAQLYYSAPGKHFSGSDRLRFYIKYVGKKKLNTSDKRRIKKIRAKAMKIRAHDHKHGRVAPFES